MLGWARDLRSSEIRAPVARYATGRRVGGALR